MDSVLGHFKQILKTLELKIAAGSSNEMITMVKYIPQEILCNYDLILHLYICLYFSSLHMVCECLCLCG